MNDFYNKIEKHLKKKGHLIAVTQDKLKLKKEHSNVLRFNFSLDDVTKQFGTVEQFFKALPSYGFTDGAILSLRRIHGVSSVALIDEINLKFPDEDFSNIAKQPDNQTGVHTQKPKREMTPETHQNNNQVPTPALGYANVPQHDYVTLMVQKERFREINDQLKDVKEELLSAKSENRILKDEKHDLQRKFDKLEDSFDTKIERIKSDHTPFHETEAGKEVLGQLAGQVPQILEAFVPKPAAMGMGNPLQGMSQLKQKFIQSLKDVPDAYLQPIAIVIKNLLNHTEGFEDQFMELIKQFNMQEANA